MKPSIRSHSKPATGALFLAALFACCELQADDSKNPAPFDPGHVLIKLKQNAVNKLLGNDHNRALARVTQNLHLPQGAELLETPFAKWSKSTRRNQTGMSTEDTNAPDFTRFMYLQLPANIDPLNCIQQIKNHPLVEYVEVDPIGTGGAVYPTDPACSDQWHIAPSTGVIGRIHAPEAWDITTGTSDVIVAVLDSGIDSNLLEFAGRLVPGTNFVPLGNPEPADDQGHGTAVSALLCANANNGTNGAGLDWNCRLMPVKVLRPAAGGGTEGNYSWWADGVDWAVANGAKIINLSAGGTLPSLTLEYSISNAVSQGAIFVTITHNQGGAEPIRFPGRLPTTIAVGASDTTNCRCLFSNYGPELDLLAPGTNIYTLTLNGDWVPKWGTSFAAPQVAGVAALMCTLIPDLNNEQARSLLCAGAEDQVGGPLDTKGFDQYHGWGRLNAYNSLVLAQTAIDEFCPTNNGALALHWNCPPNASNKEPYLVNFTSTLTNIWNSTNGVIYGNTRASWLDQNATNTTSRFYRIRIKDY